MAREWRPRSHNQYDAVERLAVAHKGVFVRELDDGTAEVLGVHRGVFKRHMVAPDGFSIVVESQRSNWRRPAAQTLILAGLAVFLSDAAVSRLPAWLGFIGWAMILVGVFVLPWVGDQVRRQHATPPDEWTELGFDYDGGD
jgi:hypothetical protein